MTYAIVETCGKQYRVQEGGRLRVDAHIGELNAEIALDKVLLVKTDAGIQVGNPYVTGAKVTAQVVIQDRGPKIIVFKFKRRKGFKKTKGHRQGFTEVKIESVA